MLADFKSRQQEVFWLNTQPGVRDVLGSVVGEQQLRTIANTEDIRPPV